VSARTAGGIGEINPNNSIKSNIVLQEQEIHMMLITKEIIAYITVSKEGGFFGFVFLNIHRPISIPGTKQMQLIQKFLLSSQPISYSYKFPLSQKNAKTINMGATAALV
jgi:hypothetical protein